VLADSVGEEDRELKEHLPPVLDTAGPLPDNVHGRKVEHLQQCLIGREVALALRDLTKLTMVALDDVGGVDELADLRRLLEEGH